MNIVLLVAVLLALALGVTSWEVDALFPTSSIFNASPLLVVGENGEIGKFFGRGKQIA